MNPLTQLKKIRILPLLIGLTFVIGLYADGARFRPVGDASDLLE